MNSDSAFLIGATHDVCQDYAVAGSRTAAQRSGGGSFAEPYVILSDGCSSSPDTDIGARLLARAAERLLVSAAPPAAGSLPAWHEEAARCALAQAAALELSPQSVDATLLTIHLDGFEAVIGCSGDGVIALQTWNGETDVYVVSYASGYPRYPAYAHQTERLRLLAGHAKEVTHYRSASDGTLRPQGRVLSDARTEVFTANIREHKLLAVCSDGIHTFFSTRRADTVKTVEPLMLEATLLQLISFKSAGGVFVKRRVRRFMKDCLARNWRHADDLSMGVVYLGA